MLTVERGKVKARSLGRQRRKRLGLKIGLGLFAAVAFITGIAFLTHLDATVIKTVNIEGNTTMTDDEIRAVADASLAGKYLHIFFKRNSLMYPKTTIKEKILAAFPRVQSVEIYTDNLQTITIAVAERKPYAVWCGKQAPSAAVSEESCYFIDGKGYLFAEAPIFTGTVFMKYYGPLDDDAPALALGTSTATVATTTTVADSIVNTADVVQPDTFIGKTFLGPKQFTMLELFIAGLARFDFSPQYISVMETGDYQLALDPVGSVLFKNDADVSRLLENMQSVISSEVYKTDAANTKQKLGYIDLRFGNKVYYKFKKL